MVIYPWFKANPTEFSFKETIIAGDECVLVTPKNSFKNWNDTDKIYRSSIWRKSDGYPVSIGYTKFTNMGETPEFEPINAHDLDSFEIREKIDGSCLIVSLYKGELIVRTRGTVDARRQDNGHELDELIFHNYKFQDTLISILSYLNKFNCSSSFIFEWVTPSNTIVIPYSTPELYLTGALTVSKEGIVTYIRQLDLDKYAEVLDVKRPLDLTEEVTKCKTSEELSKFFLNYKERIEGGVCYFRNGQILKKVKTDWYLKLHSAKFNFCSNKNILEYLERKGLLNIHSIEENLWNYKNIIRELILTDYDHEIYIIVEPLLDKIIKAINDFILVKYQEAKRLLDGVLTIEKAASIIVDHPTVNSFFAFSIARNKTIQPHRLRRIILEHLLK